MIDTCSGKKIPILKKPYKINYWIRRKVRRIVYINFQSNLKWNYSLDSGNFQEKTIEVNNTLVLIELFYKSALKKSPRFNSNNPWCFLSKIKTTNLESGSSNSKVRSIHVWESPQCFPLRYGQAIQRSLNSHDKSSCVSIRHSTAVIAAKWYSHILLFHSFITHCIVSIISTVNTAKLPGRSSCTICKCSFRVEYSFPSLFPPVFTWYVSDFHWSAEDVPWEDFQVAFGFLIRST